MRRAKGPLTTTSRLGHLACPVCGSGELLPLAVEPGLAGCHSCGCAFDGAIVGTLEQVVGLPDALGKHACEECGHPGLRLGGAAYRAYPLVSSVLWSKFVYKATHGSR